ncbi:type II toxin-antitoxin system RelB/DinJ family antitoxin [Paraeggerthella hominis]|jgi:addiction module RelB/DinJ family antitoxin|uniref:type II toxin-antitoxin system RelB/DinJ family antitoxin n=1 Tax=Paraeggerthella hominis TaxID=2897351 RepID=UPI003D0B74A3
MTAKTANISLEVDAGVKKRAMSVLEAKGMSLSGAIRRMVTLGILEHRIPFEVTRDPVFAGVGMSDCVAKHYGIDKKTTPRTGVVTGVVVKMTPDFKREMREYCKEMCITPNALVHLFLGQVAFELRIPFED